MIYTFRAVLADIRGVYVIFKPSFMADKRSRENVLYRFENYELSTGNLGAIEKKKKGESVNFLI